MCSVGDENFETEEEKCMPAGGKITLANTKCNKCRENDPIVVLRSKDAYCEACFLAGATHKFKALLGKHKLIRPNDKVLIHHQIGHPSTALLHFLRCGLDLTTHKKLRFDVIFVYVEDNSQFTVDYRKEVLKKIENEIKLFKFVIKFVSFNDYIVNNNKLGDIVDNPDNLTLNEDDKININNIFVSKLNKTNKNDILHIKKRNLLIEIAKNLNCKFILTPEISSDIASQLLGEISLGRGSHVPIDTGFCDDRNQDVKILRPLRLFDMKELAFYNKLNSLDPISIKQTEINPYSSVQDLMKKFVNDLQVNYPATVTTIMKTGDKLAINDNGKQKCQLCMGPILNSNEELSSAESTSFSHWVSTQKPDNSKEKSRQEKYDSILKHYKVSENNNYCYSCKKIEGSIKS
ncbi:unnamed protein product [Brassicogethes aeneus]|uniref:Cytoplasmic tRNA 2-thiolation protein 2 n=1 Tax=Brassicogethes aeneus TaxID=1431903 RepID=A0A9P0B1P7_BRAAE|nr:unnamed protein product [Brassicogethes aeneus]